MTKGKATKIEIADEEIPYWPQLKQAAGQGFVIISINSRPLPLKPYPILFEGYTTFAWRQVSFGSNKFLSPGSTGQYEVTDNAFKILLITS